VYRSSPIQGKARLKRGEGRGKEEEKEKKGPLFSSFRPPALFIYHPPRKGGEQKRERKKERGKKKKKGEGGIGFNCRFFVAEYS